MTAPQDTGLWLAAPPPHPALEAVVIVPARNEAEGLPATLAGQRDLHGRALDRGPFEMLLLANNCDDDSAALARRFARRHTGFALHVEDIQRPPPDAHIGTVRRLLMDAACRRLQASHPPHRVIAQSMSGNSPRAISAVTTPTRRASATHRSINSWPSTGKGLPGL